MFVLYQLNAPYIRAKKKKRILEKNNKRQGKTK